MKQNRFLLLVLLLAVTLAAAAQTATPRLVVWQKSGEKVYYDLADQPETTFADGLLTIKTTKATVSYQLANVLRYTYEGVGTSGIDLLPNERSVELNRDGDAVTFHNLRPGTAVSLYSASGLLLQTLHATSGQSLTVSLATRPGGVYIVKTGSETIKLMKP